MSKNIAIDGPAGAGKSTIARAVAGKLGYIYVDTGALYRAIALYTIDNNIDPKSAVKVKDLLDAISLKIGFMDGAQHVFLNGRDVTVDIREPKISMAASDVSAIPAVREFLFDLQLKLARENDVIMDGRDIGTVVLPHADVKIFLTATAEERANRRFLELTKKGSNASYEEILADMKERDYNDSHRAIAPLKQAADALLLDTTGMTAEQVIDRLTSIISERLG